MKKRGQLLIIEAVIAALLLLGFALVTIQRQAEKPNFADSVYKIQSQILREASDDPCVVNEVLARNPNSEEIINFTSSRMCGFPLSFNYTICDPEEVCPKPGLPATEEIYADDIVIAANLQTLKPTKLVLYSWIGKTECRSYVCAAKEKELVGCTSHDHITCFENDVYWYNSCDEKEDKKEECGNKNCVSGVCVAAACSSDNDCPADGYIGTAYCSADSTKVLQKFRDYSCTNPGTTSAKCDFIETEKTVKSCAASEKCENGACVAKPVVICPSPEKRIYFVTGSPYQSGTPPKIYYKASKVASVTSGTFAIKVFDSAGNTIGDGIARSYTLANGVSPIAETLTWPSKNSVITIYYNNACQDKYTVS